ncbi:MAG TPA: MXAN_6640 family putative metalloprotease, partial [Bacteroidota bacterium]|nr:MXAN_6640 family putative metalloprotease [Bacteroidota bacterium]
MKTTMINRFYFISALFFLVLISSAFAGGSRPLGIDRTTRQQSYNTLKQYMSDFGGSVTGEKCGLPAITYAIKNRDHLTPEVSQALQIILDRPTSQKSILVGSFRIHYDTTGIEAAAMLDSLYQPIPGTADQFADSVGAIANYCEWFETKVLGYLPSPADSMAGGGPEYDIYVVDLGDYGFTTPETPINNKPQGGTYTSFMTIDNSFAFVNPPANRGLPGMRVTIAHELHHSIQIGNYGYWTNDIYFYELTSVWMEDVVFNDVNDYYQYEKSPEGQFASPQVPFNTNSFIMYSRAIWGHYIAKRFGRDAMLRTWEEIQSAPPLEAIDRALQKPPYNSSFNAAFAEWNVWNYFTGARSDSALYYPEGAAYPEINTMSFY